MDNIESAFVTFETQTKLGIGNILDGELLDSLNETDNVIFWSSIYVLGVMELSHYSLHYTCEATYIWLWSIYNLGIYRCLLEENYNFS